MFAQCAAPLRDQVDIALLADLPEVLERLGRDGVEPEHLAVNVELHLADQAFYWRRVASVAAALGPVRLQIELTEREPFTVHRAGRVCAMASDAGADLVLDDLGEGFAGVGRLAVVPWAAVKISRTLLADACNGDAAALALLEAARDFPLVFEGVEDRACGAWIAERVRCGDLVQGYLHHRPALVPPSAP